MPKFAVKITEKLSRTYILESDTFDNACDTIQEAYNNSKIILDCDDLEETEFGSSYTFGEEPIKEDDSRIENFMTYEPEN